MLELAYGIFLCLAVLLAAINVFQAFRNAKFLSKGKSVLARRIRRENWTFVFLEGSTMLLMGALFYDLVTEPQKPNSIIIMFLAIIILKSVIKLAIYREKYLFKREMERIGKETESD